MLLKIKSVYGDLTAAEKRVADMVLDDVVGFVKKSVKEVAESAKVAPSAVIRFCKKLGIDGFSELKDSLIEHITRNEPVQDVIIPIQETDSAEKVFEKVFNSEIKALKDTFKMLNFADIEKIISLVLKAKRVVFFGVGTSSIVAIDAHYRFSQMGISASYCSDILFMNVTAANLTNGDLAIFISHSGQTRATVDAMRNAKESGAETVAISSFAYSILAKESDYAIIAFSDEKNYPVEAVSAGIAHMCIVDSLMMAIAKMKYKKLPEYLSTRNDALRNIRY